MAQHSHHGDGHGHHGHEGHGHQGKRPVHKDWRLWFAVVLMLVAMAVYVLSDDESITPGGPEQAMPAASAE